MTTNTGSSARDWGVAIRRKILSVYPIGRDQVVRTSGIQNLLRFHPSMMRFQEGKSVRESVFVVPQLALEDLAKRVVRLL